MSERRYENFELRLSDTGGGIYHVEVTASPQGEQLLPSTVQIPVEALAFPLAGGDLAALGQRLWSCLFPTPVEALYRAALAGLPAGGGLRLRLRIDPPALDAVPWELAYDPVRGAYPCLHTGTPLVRYLALPFRPSPLSAPTPLRILFAGSSPGGEPALDIAAEKERLLGALQALRSEGRVVLDTLEGRATVEALQDALRSGYRVFHFSGHGYAGGLMLEYDDGTLHRVSADALAILLGDSGVGLAVFNACDTGAQPGGLFAGVAPALVRTGLPAVVAMQAPMPDASAGTFSRNLYAALADGWPLDAAVTEGRKALALAAGLDRPDWAIPVLYLRAPDGVLWALKDEGEAGAGVSRGGESGDVYGEITVSGGVVGSIGGRGHRIQQAGGTAPGAVPGPDADLAVLRDLLLNAFSAADLRRLVLYTAKRGLRPLGREFSDNDGLAVMVDKTIQYCQTRDLLPDLLQEVARANPRQYARYERHLRSRDR